MAPARHLKPAASFLLVLGLLAVSPARIAAADERKKAVTLDTVLPSVNFDGVTLSDAMSFVHDVTDVAID